MPPSPERVQREHEIDRALEAARRLQARLELLGDHTDDVRWVCQLRNRLAGARLPIRAFPPVTGRLMSDAIEDMGLPRKRAL